MSPPVLERNAVSGHPPAADLDATDCAILRLALAGGSFGWQPQEASANAIAAALGLHRNTVLRRLGRLEADGVLLPLRFGVSPHAFGLVGGRVFFAGLDPGGARAAVRRALDVDGVFWVLRHPGGLAVTLYAESGPILQRRVRLLATLLGCAAGEWEFHDGGTAPAALLAGDVAVLRAGLAAGAGSAEAIADGSGLRVRTVQRRLRSLRRRGLVRLRPSTPLAVGRPLLAYVRAEADGPAARPGMEAMASRSAPNHLFRFLTPTACHLYLHGARWAELEAQALALRSFPGVSRVRVRQVLGIHPNPALNEWMAQLLPRLAPAGGPA